MGTAFSKNGLDSALEKQIENMSTKELHQLAVIFETWARQLRGEAQRLINKSDQAQGLPKAQSALN